jgi:hypothetical protein
MDTAIAQLVEQRSPKPQVGGSIPSRRASFGTGGVAEWSNAAVLKTVMVQAIGGSNPSPSAKQGFDRQ